MARSYQGEVVDDSEPEREELRFRERCERRRGLKDRIQSQSLRTPLAAVEIPDDELMDGQGPISALPSKVSVGLTNIELTQRAHPAVRDTPDTQTVDDTQSSTEEDMPKISLARFAYPGTTTTKKTSIISTGLSRQASSSASSIVETKPPAKRSAHKFAAHFSDSDLGKVIKCVSCDIRWTARKSAAQKMLHIQSCAKKKGLTDETVQILLRQEIESYASHRVKGKEKAVDPQTFFEVLAETAPKRKGRRKEVGETVKTISQTRNHILERARTIIAPTSSSRHTDDQESLHTQILGASGSHHNDIPPPPTQAFGNSALAQVRQTTRKLFDYDAESSDTEDRHGAPSNSPTFAPSRLGRYLNAERPLTSPVKHLLVPPSTSVHLTADDSSRERVPKPRIKRIKTSPERSGASPPLSQALSSPERDNNGDSVFLCSRDNSTFNSALDNDDAFLHFDPESEKLPYDMSSLRTKPESTFLEAPPSKIRSRTPTKSNVATTLTPSIKTKNTPSKRVKTVARMKSLLDDETVENLESKLKDKILEDSDLHLRILRYEPIHFDVFLRLMLGDSFSSVSDKARLRMRSLLDKQAIHFYGSEKTKRSRRR